MGNTATSASVSVTVANTGPVAASNFDEGSGSVLNDRTGKGHNGTMAGAGWSAAGNTCGALSFGGARVGSTDRNVNGTGAVPANAWTHLAVIYDATTIRLYVNGVQVSSVASAGNLAGSGNPLRIGGNLIWGEYFCGPVDDVRVYNRALSAAEVTADRSTPVS
ncbi:hypothetical protein ALI144C_25285 [Actinosynnema sp. ALI-1.44]|uniref:LamG domain-containing protein n=1 Tax=Actinosynnema sp. ALI-1.44 TaxID=1933779 RepID=UPI00097CA606|nr:LamG domain-containing protein [Actinosynnema sp. ALI-1.44]ONI79157.1 hypothetical protein ALI144C_25285 [Actinosynnema sp. ALI-1.44]